jgi:hypothetical protein
VLLCGSTGMYAGSAHVHGLKATFINLISLLS